MLDYMIWPWVERLPTHELLYKELFDFAGAKDLLPAFVMPLSHYKDPMVQSRINPISVS